MYSEGERDTNLQTLSRNRCGSLFRGHVNSVCVHIAHMDSVCTHHPECKSNPFAAHMYTATCTNRGPIALASWVAKPHLPSLLPTIYSEIT